MEQPLVIRLTVEHMQYQILQAIYPRESELKERVEAAVQQAIDSLDFEAEIRRQVAVELHNVIQRKIASSVDRALYYAQNASGIDTLIEAEIARQMKK